MQYKRLRFTLVKFLSPSVWSSILSPSSKGIGYLRNGEVILCFQFSPHYHLPYFFITAQLVSHPFSSYHPLSPFVLIPGCAYVYATFFFSSFSPHFFLFLWLLHSSVDAGTSIRERRSCIPAWFATGTPQYLIRSAFVWRELWRCVWMCDKKMSDCSCVCVCVLLYAELSVYIDERSPTAQ